MGWNSSKSLWWDGISLVIRYWTSWWAQEQIFRSPGKPKLRIVWSTQGWNFPYEPCPTSFVSYGILSEGILKQNKQTKKRGCRRKENSFYQTLILNVKKITFSPVYEYLWLLILDLYQRLEILLQHATLMYLSLALFVNVSFITRHRLNIGW